MSYRISYSDETTGKADEEIKQLLCGEESRQKAIILKIIKNELTQRQTQIIMLYYYKNMKISDIGRLLDISPQAVSALMARARKRIYRVLRYYYER